MAGGIYTEERCGICGGRMVDNHRNAVACPNHPRVHAHRMFVQFGRRHKKRFTSYALAMKWVNHLRTEKDERADGFDIADYSYQKHKSYAALAPKYLERKKDLKSHRKISFYINSALGAFGQHNVRDISGGMIDDYLFGMKGISEKTRANHCSQLHDFWKWCLARGDVLTLAEFPTFPKIAYELKYRKIITWEVQERVLTKVKEMTWDKNPKIWFGCDLLATYTALRPDDLRRLTEGSLDGNGWLTIFNPTKRKNKFKYVRLHREHVDLWKACGNNHPGLPDVPYFRHHGRVRGTTRSGIPFGENVFYLAWQKACKALNLPGVPLYPGTKHTTASETAKLMGSDRAKNASGLSNKAFERYCQVENNDAFEVVTEIRRKKGEVVSLGEYRGSTDLRSTDGIKSK